MPRRIIRNLCLCLLLAGLAATPAWAQKNQNPVLTDGQRAAILNVILSSSPISGALAGTRYRVFAIESTVSKLGRGRLQRQAHSLLYDYTNNKTHHVVNDITGGVPGRIIETNLLGTQLPPHPEEVAEAKALASSLDQVKRLLERPNVVIQEGFPVDFAPPAPCDVSRCLQIQVNEIIPRTRAQFLLFVTVDLSARRVVQVRDPRGTTSASLRSKSR